MEFTINNLSISANMAASSERKKTAAKEAYLKATKLSSKKPAPIATEGQLETLELLIEYLSKHHGWTYWQMLDAFGPMNSVTKLKGWENFNANLLTPEGEHILIYIIRRLCAASEKNDEDDEVEHKWYGTDYLSQLGALLGRRWRSFHVDYSTLDAQGVPLCVQLVRKATFLFEEMHSAALVFMNCYSFAYFLPDPSGETVVSLLVKNRCSNALFHFCKIDKYSHQPFAYFNPATKEGETVLDLLSKDYAYRLALVPHRNPPYNQQTSYMEHIISFYDMLDFE